MPGQTKKQSLIEVFGSVGVGYVIALLANQYVLPCFGIELDPHYIEVIIRRWEEFTGKTAIHEETGLTLPALAESRRSAAAAAAGAVK